MKKAALILFFIAISVTMLSACGKKGGLYLPAPEPVVIPLEQPQVATPDESKVEAESETGSESGPESNVEPSDDSKQQKKKPSEQ